METPRIFLNVSKKYICNRMNYITMDYITIYKAFTPYHVVLKKHRKGKGTYYPREERKTFSETLSCLLKVTQLLLSDRVKIKLF